MKVDYKLTNNYLIVKFFNMLDFNKDILLKLEELSKIKCKKEEEILLMETLQKILKHIEKLDEIDTENILPCNFVQQEIQKNVFRKDEKEEIITKEAFIENTPDIIDGMVKIPSFLG